MKVQDINIVAGILAKVNFGKDISDQKIRLTLYNDFYHIRRIVKQASEDRQEIIDKFQADWRDSLAAVQAFRQENKPVVGHDDFLEAEKNANEAISALFSAEVDATLKPVKIDAFMAAYKGNELTFEDIAALQESGVLEE